VLALFWHSDVLTQSNGGYIDTTMLVVFCESVKICWHFGLSAGRTVQHSGTVCRACQHDHEPSQIPAFMCIVPLPFHGVGTCFRYFFVAVMSTLQPRYNAD